MQMLRQRVRIISHWVGCEISKACAVMMRLVIFAARKPEKHVLWARVLVPNPHT